MRLLKLVDKHGSITRAAGEMKMSYRHAWGIINKINEAQGEKVVESERGGTSGGMTRITKAGRKLIQDYEERKKGTEIIMKYGPRPAITVDGIIVKRGKVLLIKRKNPPFKDAFALPGGFVEYREPVEDAVVREIAEETGLRTKIERLVGVYSAPDRDPRGHTISVIYELSIISGSGRAGSDARAIQWFSLDLLPQLAFDHREILNDFLEMRSK